VNACDKKHASQIIIITLCKRIIQNKADRDIFYISIRTTYTHTHKFSNTIYCLFLSSNLYKCNRSVIRLFRSRSVFKRYFVSIYTIYTHIYICVCLCVALTRACAYICIYIYIYTHIYIYIFIYCTPPKFYQDEIFDVRTNCTNCFENICSINSSFKYLIYHSSISVFIFLKIYYASIEYIIGKK